MATNGTRIAKPFYIPMTDREWDALSDSRKKALISAGKSSAELPAPPVVTTPPMQIQSSKAKALLERITESKEHTYALQQLWISLKLCECAPDARQFQLWFKHEFETIVDSFHATAAWLSKLRNGERPEAADEKTHDDKVRYASAVMNNMVKGEQAVTANQAFGDGAALPDCWDTLDGGQKRKLIAAHKGRGDE
jgi:hypothetical protein